MILVFCTLSLLLSVATIGISADDPVESADFIMTSEELNIPGSALLAIEGCFSYDESQYTRGAAIIGVNDMAKVPEEVRGHILLHGGRGDAYTFTVDFGTYSVDSFGFYSYGSAFEDTVVGLEIDGQSQGSATAYAGNGWADADPSVWFYNEIVFPTTYNGVHTVTIRILESAPAWPANVIGNFYFYAQREAAEETDFTPIPDTEDETKPTTEPATAPSTEPVTEPATQEVTEPTIEFDSAPVTGAPGSEFDEDTTEASKSGCGSVVEIVGVFMLICVAGAVFLIRNRPNKFTVMSMILVLSTMLTACQSPTDPPVQSDTQETVSDVTQTQPDETQTQSQDTETSTNNEQEDVPMTPDLMVDLTYNEEEKQSLAATAEKMKGLRITHYSDRAATKKVYEGVVPDANINFRKGSGVSAVVLEGFISFEQDGEYTLSCPDSIGVTITVHEGEHHLRAGSSIQITAKAQAQYGIKLTAAWNGNEEDQFLTLLSNGEESGFSLAVGRILLEHEPVSLKPILDIPLRDTFICTGPDGYYYMTGTTGPDFWTKNYVIHVYRSADLMEWEDLGVVWDYRTDATWAQGLSIDGNVPVWAPELAYINGNWYMTYSLGFSSGFCGGILVSTTGKPEGPYTDTAQRKLVDNIDGSLFQDDDGTVYYIYKDGLIATMNDDLTGFTSEFKPLYAADGLPVGFEGCYILKHNGKYYLTAATYNQSYDKNGNIITTYDSMIAVSDNVYGPYSEARLLMRNGGHNNLFVDKNGCVQTTLFAPTGSLGFNCQPAVQVLHEDERGILSVVVPKTGELDVNESGVFRLTYAKGTDPVLNVQISTRRPVDVYINGVYAFTAEPSLNPVNYVVTGNALNALVSGQNRITFSDTRRADLTFTLSGSK